MAEWRNSGIARVRTVSLVLALAGCAAQSHGPATPAPASGTTLARPSAGDLVTDLVTAALDSDARLQSADSLYAPGAVIVADGRRRSGVPRFSGVEPGGQLVVSASRVEVTGTFAWADVEYRWMDAGRNLLREGRSTFVLSCGADGKTWKILHTHSSSGT
jgi:hypothetical protein